MSIDIKSKSLWELIQEKINPGPENARGWHPVKCACCNDYQERGGFTHDGIYTSFYDWNCGEKFKYEEGSGKFSRSARQILHDFGITRDDLASISSSVFFNKNLTLEKEKEENEITLKAVTAVKLFTPEVAFPDRTLPLGCDGHDESQAPLIEYLIGRQIDPIKFNIHFSLNPRYLRRVIIPFERDGKLIFWQARSIDSDVKPRYLNCVVSRDAVLYGYDELTTWSTKPLFVTEGVFDAMSIGGICLLGSKLNAAKIEILKKTKRRIIFVIDRDKTGDSLGQTVIDNDWEFTFVDENASDINDSVCKFGLPFTVYSLLKNVTKNLNREQAKLSLAMGMLEAKLRGSR